jgi:hypothetical protein
LGKQRWALAFKLQHGGRKLTHAEDIRHAIDYRKEYEARRGTERGAP